MKPIMTDSKKKCENYQDARTHTVKGFHDIRLAEAGADIFRKKSCTIGGNRDSGVPKINRHGKTVRNGWIGKNGFNPHT
jgi:hypothetical protein